MMTAMEIPPLRPNVEAAARDHLANERTFLAWFRTGFAVAGVGIALPKLVDQDGLRAWLAAGLVSLYGAALMFYGVLRHRRSDRALLDGQASIDTRGPTVVVVAAALVVLIAALLLDA
jgi:putative membrane protein